MKITNSSRIKTTSPVVARPKTTAIAHAVRMALATSSAALMASTAAYGQDSAGTGSRALEEIVVTASRRSEGAQDVPITLQAIGTEDMKNLGIGNFEDYVALLPGVSGPGQTPGGKDVFMRGISGGKRAIRNAGIGNEPSVAFYLDETPISTGGRNIDLYAADLNRIEVLKGPQGTLFGASAQAGAIRLITNKPVLNEFEAGFTLGFSSTHGGDDSNQAEGYINFPLIDDKLAARFAIYNTTQGGFIDNVPASRQIPLSNPGLGGIVPSFRTTIRNEAVAEDNFNNATYRGIRASLYFTPTENWDFNLQYTRQNLDIEGVFDFRPEIGEFEVENFAPDNGSDVVDLVAWSASTQVAELELIYNGSFTDRTAEAVQDYTQYVFTGGGAPYYTCEPGFDSCGTPEMFTNTYFNTDRITHELRVATDPSKRWNIIAGVFYDDSTTIERADFNSPATIDNGFAPNAPIPGAIGSLASTRAPGVFFFNDFVRGREEISFFGEFAFDIMDNLTATFGLRDYELDISMRGNSSFGTQAPIDGDAGNAVTPEPDTLSDTIFKANLSWNMSENVLMFGTYSEGYRSGGFNRNGGQGGIPFTWDTDDVENYELGWKSTFLDGTFRFNGAVYYIDLTGIQTTVLDQAISNSAFTDNTGVAEIKGVDLDFEWAATDEFRLFGAISYIDSELISVPSTIINLAPVGSELAFSPELQYHIGGRYEHDTGENVFFAQGVYKNVGEQYSNLVASNRFLQDDYDQLDISLGVQRDQWTATFFVNNLTDELGVTYAHADDNTLKYAPTRPRTAGIRFSFDYQ